MIRWVKDCDELLAAEPDEVRRVIREHEEAGFTACPEYQAAILPFYREHVCRLSPWPAESLPEAGYASVCFVVGGVSMPLVCFLSGWWKPLRHLFFIPVTALILAAVFTIRGGP